MGTNFTIRCLGQEILRVAMQLRGGAPDFLAIKIFLVVDSVFSPGTSRPSPTLRLAGGIIDLRIVRAMYRFAH